MAKNLTTAADFVVPLSKTRIVLLLAGALGIVALGLWLWVDAEHMTRHSPLYVRGVAAVSIAFFGLCGLAALVKFFDDEPGLILNFKGVTDNATTFSAGLIPWSEILGFKITTVRDQRFLTIVVKDPQKYLAKASVLQKPFVAANIKYFGGPIHISANALKIGFDDLVTAAREMHERYGRK